jgi:hypothetical protein
MPIPAFAAVPRPDTPELLACKENDADGAAEEAVVGS